VIPLILKIYVEKNNTKFIHGDASKILGDGGANAMHCHANFSLCDFKNNTPHQGPYLQSGKNA
jgi:hypothetical protein